MIKSGHFILAVDGSRMMVPGLVLEFRDYTYTPKSEEEFNAAKEAWEKQWGNTPDDGVGVCAWGELPDEAMTTPEGSAEKFVPLPDESRKRTQVVQGPRTTLTGGAIRT